MDQQLTDKGLIQPLVSSLSNPHSGATVKIAAGYVLQERLGSGSFATVYKGIQLSDYQEACSKGKGNDATFSPNSIAAIKAISRSSKKLTKKVLENLDMEIAILRTYHHPNIVCLHDVQKTDRHYYLILEYCGGGDLQRLIRTRKTGRLTERLCCRLIRDLAAGLAFLWGKELVHRDIKPQNLLLTGALPEEELLDNPPREDMKRLLEQDTDNTAFMLKIADFGFARHLSGVDLAETMCGSPLYMAPEVLLGQKYDAKADLWSVGTVLFEMISGRTPFHGENHMDLLNNIKRKAVRLPADVRVSKECVSLLRILLDRKPQTRADFKAFYDATEAFLAQNCVTDDRIRKLNLTIMPLNGQMDLCAISENEAIGESLYERSGTRFRSSESIVETPTTQYPHQSQQSSIHQLTTTASQGTRDHRIMITSKSISSNAIVQLRKDYTGRPGVVTPPLNNATPTSLTQFTGGTGHFGNIKQCGRSSVFAPLQGSPNLPPSLASATTNVPTLSLKDYDDVSSVRMGDPKVHSQRDVAPPSRQHQWNHPAQNENRGSQNVNEIFDSGFVLVDHDSYGSKPDLSQQSHIGPNKLACFTSNEDQEYYEARNRYQSIPSKYSSSQMIISSGNVGILGTSPATGQALVGKMMGYPQSKSGGTVNTTRFNIEPPTAFRNGGCLAHIESLARMLAAAEDIGRRAISVAHLGDSCSYVAMGLLIAQRDGSQSTSSSCMLMDEIEEEALGEHYANSKRSSIRENIWKKRIVEENEEDELPFAMMGSLENESNDEKSNSPMAGISSNPFDAHHSCIKDEVVTATIRNRFREALMCYMKSLSMMKGSVCAAQKIIKDVDGVKNIPSIKPYSGSNNPYSPLKERCSGSLEWLRGQFSAVLERADAANEQISKLEKLHSSKTEVRDVTVSVEELIYNHSLKCGREGAIMQILGHYDAARSSYRSAGLLVETLLMEPKVVDEDKIVLERYVQCFANQIMELDGLLRMHVRNSRSSNNSMQGESISGTDRLFGPTTIAPA